MRIDRLTNQLQIALSDAQSLAVGRDHNQLEPVHVLLAMLDQQGGSVRPLLVQAGFDVTGLRNDLAKKLDNLPRIQAPTGDVHMSAETGRLLNLADKRAQENGDKFISSESVLLAAMADGKSDLGKALNRFGDCERLGGIVLGHCGCRPGAIDRGEGAQDSLSARLTVMSTSSSVNPASSLPSRSAG